MDPKWGALWFLCLSALTLTGVFMRDPILTSALFTLSSALGATSGDPGPVPSAPSEDPLPYDFLPVPPISDPQGQRQIFWTLAPPTGRAGDAGGIPAAPAAAAGPRAPGPPLAALPEHAGDGDGAGFPFPSAAEFHASGPDPTLPDPEDYQGVGDRDHADAAQQEDELFNESDCCPLSRALSRPGKIEGVEFVNTKHHKTRPFQDEYGHRRFPCCRQAPRPPPEAAEQAAAWSGNATKGWLAKRAGTTIVFSGDGMARRYVEALACLIERDAGVRPKSIHVSDDPDMLAEYANGLRLARVTCEAQRSEGDPGFLRRCLTDFLHSQKGRKGKRLVVLVGGGLASTGHHWKDLPGCGLESVEKPTERCLSSYRKMAKGAIAAAKQVLGGGAVMVLGTTPEHFASAGKSGDWTQKAKAPGSRCARLDKGRVKKPSLHWRNRAMKEAALAAQVPYHGMWDLLAPRWDAHLERAPKAGMVMERPDCLNWCANDGVWRPLLARLLAAMPAGAA